MRILTFEDSFPTIDAVQETVFMTRNLHLRGGRARLFSASEVKQYHYLSGYPGRPGVVAGRLLTVAMT